MNIVVCYKMTPDPADIETRRDGSISLDRAEWTIGSLDLQAIEAGVRLAEVTGGKVTGLSAGPQQIDNSKLKKDFLSRGAAELVLIVDPMLNDADTFMTARVLAEAIHKLEPVDLVICGEGSADLYFQQVGLQLGELLGWITINAISRIGPLGGNALLVERTLEDEIEVIEAPMPAVLSVTTDINPPRLPTMMEILKAGKKPIRQWTLADLGLAGHLEPGVEVVAVTAPQSVERKHRMLTGTAEEVAAGLLDGLKREGVL